MRGARASLVAATVWLLVAHPASAVPLQGWLEDKLSAATGGEARFGSLSWDVTGLGATFTDLTLKIPAGDSPALDAKVRSGRLSLAWSGIASLPGGRVRIASLVLEDPDVSIDARIFDVVAARERSGKPVEVEIAHLEVVGGRLRYSDPSQGLQSEVHELEWNADWDAYRKSLAGPVAASGTVRHAPLEKPLPFSGRGALRASQRGLDLVGLEIEAGAPSSRLGVTLEGALRLAGHAAFSATASIRGELAGISPFLSESFPAVEGTAEAQISIDKSGPGFLVLGRARGTAVRFGPLRAARVDTALALRPGGLELTGLVANAYGGSVSGDVAVAFADPPTFHARLDGRGLDAAPLIALAHINLPVAAKADGRFEVAGEPGSPATWTGRAAFTAVQGPAEEGRLPASGSGAVTFETGHARIDKAPLVMGSARFDLDVDADLTREPVHVRLNLSGATDDASRTHAATLRLLEALDVSPPDVVREPLAGRGTMAATIETGGGGALDLDLDLRDGSWSGQSFDHAALALGLRAGRLTVRGLEAERGTERVEATASLTTEPFSLDAIDARATGLALRPLLERFHVGVDLDGTVSGSLRATRSADALTGDGSVTLRDAVLDGESIDEAGGSFTLNGAALRFESARVAGAWGEGRGPVAVDLGAGTAIGRVQGGTLRPAGVHLFERAGITAGGEIVFTGPFSWTTDGPTADFTLEGHGVRVAKGTLGLDRPDLGDVRGTVRLEPRRAIVDLAEARTGAWLVGGTLALDADATVDATLTLDNVSLSVESGLPAGVALRATTRMSIRGPLAAPERLAVEGALEGVTLSLGSRQIAADADITLKLEQRVLSIGPARFKGGSSEFEAGLVYDLGADSMDATVRGALDLDIVAALESDVRASGTADVDLRVRGTMSEPALEGRVEVRGARVRVLGFPQSFDDFDATFVLDGHTATLEGLRSRCGGGEVSGEGRIDFDAAGWRYSGIATAVGVSVGWPEGFRGVYGGNLRVAGDASGGKVSGHLEMSQGLYNKDLDVLGLVASSSRIVPEDESMLPRTIALDVTLSADGNVWMRNNVGRVEGRVDLAVGGNLARPEITGRIEVFDGGTVRFRDVEYTIESATLDLVDRRKIDPIIDLRGRTQVRNYEISLHIEGTVDHLRYEISSNPALPEQDIIAMLLTGQTVEDIESSAAQRPGAGTGDLAANYFAGVLSSRFTGPIGKAFGLDQFQLNPLLVEGRADPTARVTVGKRVGENVSIVYSGTLGATQDQVYQVKWDVTRAFRFSLERSTAAGVGGDFSWTLRFGGTPAGAPRAPTLPHAAATGGGAPIASVAVEGVDPREAEKLARLVPLAPGKPFSRARLYEGAEAIRGKLVDDGNIEAQVGTRLAAVEPEPGSTAPSRLGVSYEVEQGPKVNVSVSGGSWRDRRRQSRKLSRFWKDSLFSIDLYDEAEDVVRRDLEERGHYASDVEHRVGEVENGVRAVVYAVDPGKPVKVASVRFAGNAEVADDRLRAVMLTKPTALFAKSLLDSSVLADDLRALRAFYRNDGFLEVRIDPPLVQIAATGDRAEVTIPVAEGPRYTVGGVTVPADTPFPTETLRSWCGLVPGATFSPAAQMEAETALRNRFDENGYPNAVIESDYALAEGRANVSFRIRPGGYERVAAVEITGNALTREKVIRRELRLTPGDPVSRERMLDTQRRLYRLGLFRSVRFEDVPASETDAVQRTLRVRVEEAPPITLSLGPGYDSELGARATFSLSHDNLWGFNRSVALQGRWSQDEKRLQLVGKDPRLFNRELEGLVAFFWEKERQTGFAVERRSTAVRILKKIDRRWTRYLRYNFQRADTTFDPGADILSVLQELLKLRQVADARLGDFGFAFVRDTRDDPFLATRGGYVSTELRVFAKPFLSDVSFEKLTMQGAFTKTFGNRTQYAGSIRLGAEQPWGSTGGVPVPERYFAGGESSLRGFARDHVGPSVELSDPLDPTRKETFYIGGEAEILLNQEWRVPIWRGLKGVLFADAGNVYLRLRDADLGDTREAAGLGVRYDTPIGPLRVEYGWKLDRRAGESPGQFHLAIGGAF